MKYRRFRTTGGQFLDALLTVDGDEFSVSAESHQADHEAGYGISPLEVVEAYADPWDGVSVLITTPPRTITPTPTLAEALTPEMAGLETAIAELKSAFTDPAQIAAAEKMRLQAAKMKAILAQG